MKRHSKEIKDKALELFLDRTKNYTLEQIAQDLKIPFETVKSWHKLGKWAKENKKNCRKTAEKIQKTISDKNAKKELSVLAKERLDQTTLDGIIEKKKTRTFEKIAAIRAKIDSRKTEGKITGEIVERTENQHTLKDAALFAEVAFKILNE